VAYQKSQLYVLDNGNLASRGWMTEMKEKVGEIYAPKWEAGEGVEELEKEKGWEHYSGKDASFFKPTMVTPVRDAPPPGCFEHILALFNLMRIARKETYHRY
jgi:hypothetical protein